jgi:hypothetical protein
VHGRAEIALIARVVNEWSKGCIMKILHRNAIPGLLSERDLKVGGFAFEFCGSSARHRIVTYRTEIDD